MIKFHPEISVRNVNHPPVTLIFQLEFTEALNPFILNPDFFVSEKVSRKFNFI